MHLLYINGMYIWYYFQKYLTNYLLHYTTTIDIVINGSSGSCNSSKHLTSKLI